MRTHAIDRTESFRSGDVGFALCGARPGERELFARTWDEATCHRCLAEVRLHREVGDLLMMLAEVRRDPEALASEVDRLIARYRELTGRDLT